MKRDKTVIALINEAAEAADNAGGLLRELHLLAGETKIRFKKAATIEGGRAQVVFTTDIPTENSPNGLTITVNADGDMTYDGQSHPVCPGLQGDYLGESFKTAHARRDRPVRLPVMTREALDYVRLKAQKASLG